MQISRGSSGQNLSAPKGEATRRNAPVLEQRRGEVLRELNTPDPGSGLQPLLPPEPEAFAKDFNDRLLALHSQALQSAEGSSAALKAEAELLLAARARALEKLMALDPAQALAEVLPVEVLITLAKAFPEAVASLESHGSWQGRLEIFEADDSIQKHHRTIRRFTVAGQATELHLTPEQEAGLDCGGGLVNVQGVRLGGQIVAASAVNVTLVQKAGTNAAAAQGCTTTGEQKSLVLMVTFPGVTPPANVTKQFVQDMFFGTAGRSLDRHWRASSAGQAWASGDVLGWYTLDRLYACGEGEAMRDAAFQAANADAFFPNYTRVFIVFPDATCGFTGISTRGCGGISSPDGAFTASSTWLTTTPFTSLDQSVMHVTHEGGHALGFGHGNALDYGTQALGALSDAGTSWEYGDYFTTMGYWNLGQYSAPHKAKMGWLTSGINYQTVQGNGAWSLQPLETSPAGLQALKIQRGTGNDGWLWVEYRQPASEYDLTLPSQVFSGALVHYETSTNTGEGKTYLLDFTPETDAWEDPALASGRTWTDPYSNLTLSIGSATSSALTVTVTYGAAACIRANPAVTISPSNLSAAAGAAGTYTVTVVNKDSSSCASNLFTLSSSLPAGWQTGFSPNSLTLAPGQSGTVSMTKTVPAGTTAATYGVDATAVSGSYSGTGTANCTVTAPVTSSISAVTSVAGSTFKQKSVVPITATVTSGGSPAANASVTITLIKSNGSRSTQLTKTDSTGKVVWNYRLGPKDPTGAYSTFSQVTYNSQTATTNTALFMVQ